MPYAASVIADDGQRLKLVGEGWSDVGKLTIMACVLDAAFQLIEFRWIYPFETAFVAVLLAIVPYVLLRGISQRLFAKLPK